MSFNDVFTSTSLSKMYSDFNEIKYEILKTANQSYPAITILEIENGRIVGLEKYDLAEIVAAMQDLADEYLINEDVIRISVDNIISITGHLNITSKGRKRLLSKTL